MKFGVKVADAKPAPMRSPISWFGKDDLRIRFLEEIGEWTQIGQHFSNSARSSYPCTYSDDDRDARLPNTCPGCNSDDEREAKPSTRYIANAVDVQRGYANLYTVPYSLMSPLRRYAEKDGDSIMARDYTVVQYKEDGFTKYAVEKEEREKFNFDKFELKNHEEALNQQWQIVWGDNDSPAAQSREPKGEVKKIPAKAAVKAAVKEEKDDRLPAGARAPKNMRESIQAKESEDPPSEPQQEQDAAEETLTMTEEEIRAMSLEELVRLYDQCGVDWNEEADEPAQFLIDSLS